MVRKWVLGAACAGALYGLWQVSLPPRVDAVHTFNGQPWLVLVQHFPLTQQGKIEWWDRNQAMLKAKYGLSYDDQQTLRFAKWDGKYLVDPGRQARFFEDANDFDLLCFDEDMNAEARCIKKGTVIMTVNKRSDGGMRFTVEGPTGEATYVRAPGSDALRRLPD